MDEKKALNHCARLCSEREYCLSEIDEKLQKLDIESEARQRILGQLVSEKYIDEQRYANYFARDKARFNGWGPQKIRFMLQQKKVAQDVIAAAIDSVDTEIFAEQLFNAIDSKAKSEKNTDIVKLKQKLYRLGASRGFDFDAVKKAVALVLDSDDNDD